MLYWQSTGGNVRTNTTRGGDPPQNAPGALNRFGGTHANLTFMLRWLQGQIGGNVSHGFHREAYPFGIDNNRYHWVPNVINLDFVSDAVCDRIIAFNQANITAAGQWRNVE
jgi:hypothetical protein